MDAVLRQGVGRQGRQEPRPAQHPAGDRDADPRQRLFGGVRGRPVGALAGRRRAPPRRHPRRRPGPSRCAQHVVPRSLDRQGGRGGARVRRVRSRPGRRALVGGAGAARGAGSRGPWASRPPYRPRWIVAYAAAATLIATFPLLATLAAFAAVSPWLHDTQTFGGAARDLVVLIPLGTVTGFVVLAALVWILVRCLGSAWRPDRIRFTADRGGRRGPPCGPWTRHAPGCSRSTQAR